MAKIKGIADHTGKDDEQSIDALEEGHSGVYRITPHIANFMISNYNYGNRHIRKASYAELLSAIKSGKFVLNGETIILHHNEIDGEVHLKNGQHRLLACIEADKPIFSVVVFPPKSQIMGTIDTGAKRSLADYLVMENITDKYATMVATITKYAYLHDKAKKNPFAQIKVPYPELIPYVKKAATIKRIRQSIDTARFGQTLKELGILQSTTVYFTYQALKKYPESIVSGFIHRMGSGTDDEGNLLPPHGMISKFRKNSFGLLKRHLPKGRHRHSPMVQKIIQYNFLVTAFNHDNSGKRSAPKTFPMDELLIIEKGLL